MSSQRRPLRSEDWFGRKDKLGFIHRSWTKAEGFPQSAFDACQLLSALPLPVNARLREYFLQRISY